MKFLRLLFCVIFLAACTVPEEITIIKKKYYNEEYNQQSDDEEDNQQSDDVETKKIFPVDEAPSSVPSFIGPIKTPKDDDFEDGIMYIDNSYSTDGIVHNLDLSTLVGSKESLVGLQIRAVPESEGGNDSTETYIAYFKPNGLTVNYIACTATYNNWSDIIWVITDDTGNLQWYSDYNWAYWANPGCDPGFEIYKWLKIEIWAVFYINGNLTD